MDLKKSQNWHFCKRVSPWFRPKLSNFFISSFQVRYIKKKCFVTFYIENQHGLKKAEKWTIFQRGQSMVLHKIMKFVYFIFLGKIRKKTYLVTFQIENQHFQTMKTWIKKKSQNWQFSKGVSPWLQPKLISFYICSFQVRQAKKKSFVTFQIENQHFQTIKTMI